LTDTDNTKQYMKIHIYNSKKQTTQNTAEQNDPGSVASYNTRPGNKMGLLYNASRPTQGNQYEIV